MDGKTSALLKDSQRETPSRTPRLLNAAAWLETLTALEEEFKSILANNLGITSGPLATIGGLDLNKVGYLIVGLFLTTWVMALAVWCYARMEDKWIARFDDNPSNAR